MILLESSKFGSLRQASSERCFYLDFDEKRVKLTFCQLLALRQKINGLNVDSLFSVETNPHDFKILTLCNNQHLFLLNALQLLDLKVLLQNTFASMGLSRHLIPVAA